MSLSTLDRAHLASDSYEDRSREAQGETAQRRVVEIEGREYEIMAHATTRTGYQGTAYRDMATNEVVIAHRGTELSPTSKEFLLDVVRADGGMVAKGINAQAEDAIAFTELAMEKARKWAESEGRPLPPITVTGHSLGGALAQITAHRFGLRGETYNSYGAAELAYLQGPPEPGAEVINHVRAIDFVSSASHHFGEVRGYATEADLGHLRRHDYGLPAYRPDVPSMVSPTTALARLSLRPDPAAAALSPEGIGAHGIGTMATNSFDTSILNEANRQRYEANHDLVDAYRSDIRDIRFGISVAAQMWPRTVEAIGHGAQLSADAITAAQTVAPAIHNPIRAAGIGRSALGQLRDWMADAPRRPTIAEQVEPFIRKPASAPGGTLDTHTIEESVRQSLPGIGERSSGQSAPHAATPAALRPFGDPQHPQHALYAELKETFRANNADVSEPRLAQFTAALHADGIKPGGLKAIDINADRAMFTARSEAGTFVRLGPDRPPSVQESLQRVEDVNQQRQEREQERQQQAQQTQAQQNPEQMRAGPSLSLGP